MPEATDLIKMIPRSDSLIARRVALMARDSKKNARARRLTFVRRIVGMALLAGLPALIVALVLLWSTPYSSQTQWTLTILITGCWLGISLALRPRVEIPLHTLSNLLSALREGDYSLRARATRGDDALEATTLLRKVMEEIDVAVFAFDAGERLRLVNRAGERLLAQPAERLLGS